MTLHIFNKSPQSANLLQKMSEYINKDDSVIFIEDGVYIALANALNKAALDQLSTQDIYVLKDDLQARGIDVSSNETLKYASFNHFVELTAQHPKSISWY